MKSVENRKIKIALEILQYNDDYICIGKDGDCVLDGYFTVKELEAILEILKAGMEYDSIEYMNKILKGAK